MAEKWEPPRGWKQLLTWRFQGHRFDQHGIDLRDLRTLGSARDILVEILAEEWQSNHDGEDLPNRFWDHLELQAFVIQDGSAALPVCYRIPEDPDDPSAGLPHAVGIFLETLRTLSHGDGTVVPASFPPKALSKVKKLTSSLRAYESIKIDASVDGFRWPAVVVDVELRDSVNRILQRSKSEARIDPRQIRISGTVYMADVSQRKALISTENEHVLTIHFAEEQGKAITRALHSHDDHLLYVEGVASFDNEGKPYKIGRLTNVAAIKQTFLRRWRAPCESMFAALAREDPAELIGMVSEGGLKVPDLTFAVEHLGTVDDAEMVVPTLLEALKHPSSLVREGAIYGIARHLERPEVRAAIEELSKSDTSSAVRAVATEALAE